MKVVLFMATSLTGKTTSGADDTSWVDSSDIQRMDVEMNKCGVMIMGKSTYESFENDLPVGKALLVVMTHDKNLLNKQQDGLLFTNSSPKVVLEVLEKKGFKRAMLAGGEKLNSSFLQDDLVNEIRIIVKPVIIGQGKSLFNIPITKTVQYILATPLANGSIELAYNVAN